MWRYVVLDGCSESRTSHALSCGGKALVMHRSCAEQGGFASAICDCTGNVWSWGFVRPGELCCLRMRHMPQW